MGGSSGGSGGGGGGAGVVDYPAYMKDFQGDLLNHTGADTIASSLVDIMNAGFGNNPFTGEIAYNPDTALDDSEDSVDDFSTLVALLSAGTGLDALIASVLDDTRIDASVVEFAADLDDRLVAEVLPRFEGGMLDINAVVSSAFVIGKANIEASQTRQVSKYSADLHLQAFGEDALRVIALKLDYQRMLTQTTIENNRIRIVAKKEEAEVNLNIDEADATWDLGLFQYGSNLLAGIGGGTAVATQKKQSQTASAVGGAMSGAVGGAMVGAQYGSSGGVYGAVIGAVVGAAASFLS